VVVISCVLRGDDGLRVFSLEGTEAEVIRRFYEGIEKFVPQLVSWNGGGFDLPVLELPRADPRRRAPLFWETGRREPRLPLQQLRLALPQPATPTSWTCSPCTSRATTRRWTKWRSSPGLPGKIGVGGAKVWEPGLAGEDREDPRLLRGRTRPTLTCCSCATSCSEGLLFRRILYKEKSAS
jgi:hypothetical protein